MSRALVLSGGGPVGIAWESGIAAGLASGGVDLSEADFIIGTSAGSVVGAQIAQGTDMHAVVERYRRSAVARGETPANPSARGATGEQMQQLMAAFAELFTSDAPAEQKRAKIGRVALAAQTVPEETFLANFRHLSDGGWPSQYRCTACDAESGEFVVWDADRGVDIVRAAASSCAVPGIFPPITIGGRRYIDGGMRSASNADLATGYDNVLVVTLFSSEPGDARMEAFRRGFESELQTLRDGGASVEVISPDADSRAAFGVNLMDPSVSPAAAEAGLAQGAEAAARLAGSWSD